MNCHCPLTAHTPSSGLVFIHRAQWKILPTFLEMGESPSILSPVLFSRWRTVGTSQRPFSDIFWPFHCSTLSSLTLAVGKYSILFSLLWTRREVACVLIVFWSLLPAFQRHLELSLAEHNVPLFRPLEGRPYCLKWTFTEPEQDFKSDLDGSDDRNLQLKLLTMGQTTGQSNKRGTERSERKRVSLNIL